MKIAVFADLHVTNSNPKFKITDGVSDLLTAQYNYVKHVVELAEQEDCKAILFLGDFTDDETLDPVVQTYSNKMIKALSEFSGLVVLLEGNHCVSDSENAYTVLGAAEKLCESDNIMFITSREMCLIDGLQLYCVPYMSDYLEIERQIQDVNEQIAGEDFNQYMMLFHFPTKNAMLDNGLKSTSGVNLSEDIVSNFDMCLGGDFHKPQQIHDNCYYVGAPFDFKFGEHIPNRGTTIVDTDDWSMERVPNPYQYRILNVDVEEFLDRDWKYKDKTIVKITGSPTSEQLVEVDKLVDGFYRSITYFSKREQDDPVDLKVDIVEDNGGNDIDLIRNQMVKSGVEEEVLERSLEIFESEIG